MSQASQRVTCPSCGKGYRWQSSLIGKKVPCKQCGQAFTVPDTQGKGLAKQAPPVANFADDGTYALDIEEPTASSTTTTSRVTHNGKCPSCNSPLREGAILCMNCGFNAAEGKKIQTAVADTPTDEEHTEPSNRTALRMQRDMATAADTHQQHLWQEYRLPIILLCIGFAFMLLNALALMPAVNDMLANKGYSILSNSEAVIAYIISFGITLVLMLPLLIGGVFFMAAVFGSAFGNLFTAMLKLLALTVFVVALDNLIDLLLDLGTGGFGGIGYGIRLAVVLAAFYPICLKLFDMESHEIWIMFLIYVLGPIAIGMLALMITMNFF